MDNFKEPCIQIANRRICIIVALPEERIALVKKLKHVKRVAKEGIPFYYGELNASTVCVVEGGMGMASALKATLLLLSELKPGLIISAGFCGAVRAGGLVADLVICKRLFNIEDNNIQEVLLPGAGHSAGRLSAELQLRGLRTWQGSFITSQKIIKKAELSASLPSDLATPVLEMESTAVARIAIEAKIPFLGLRSISDDADEELGFSLDELSDSNLKISIPRVIMTCIKKPRIIPQLARMAVNSAQAGRNLGSGLVIIESLIEPLAKV